MSFSFRGECEFMLYNLTIMLEKLNAGLLSSNCYTVYALLLSEHHLIFVKGF